MLHGRIARLHVYAASTTSIAVPATRPGFRFRYLADVQLRSLRADPAFCARQLERLHRFGASYAYAVYISDTLAHISWLLPASVLAIDEPRVFRAMAHEAEITACETLPEFRGQGVYPFAIGHVCAVAKEQGVQRIFMKTNPTNAASRAGIMKAGLQLVGSAWLINVPRTPRAFVLRQFR